MRWPRKTKSKVKRRSRKGVPMPPHFLRRPGLNKVWEHFCWITNNEMRPKHEVEFDIAFFIINTLAVSFGVYSMLMSSRDTAPFAAMLIIEWTWALDTIRNNRSYIK